MPRIIFLCGQSAVGKSTTSLLLYRRLPKAAYIDGDWLTSVQAFISDSDVSPIKLKNGAALIGNFLDAGCEDIVADGLVDSSRELQTLLHLLSARPVQCMVFLLFSDTAVRTWRWNAQMNPADPARPLEEVDRKVGTIDIDLPGVPVIRLDTTEELPEQIVERMLQALQ